jgi:hypothetical protein
LLWRFWHFFENLSSYRIFRNIWLIWSFRLPLLSCFWRLKLFYLFIWSWLSLPTACTFNNFLVFNLLRLLLLFFVQKFSIFWISFFSYRFDFFLLFFIFFRNFFQNLLLKLFIVIITDDRYVLLIKNVISSHLQTSSLWIIIDDYRVISGGVQHLHLLLFNVLYLPLFLPLIQITLFTKKPLMQLVFEWVEQIVIKFSVGIVMGLLDDSFLDDRDRPLIITVHPVCAFWTEISGKRLWLKPSWLYESRVKTSFAD